jgi:soluble lytic murein transglycosylase-like protein
MIGARHKRFCFSLLLSAGVMGSVSQLDAETIFFANGRMLSVKGHRIEGDMMTVSLQHGGEASFDKSIVVRIVPDEVTDTDADAKPEMSAEAADPSVVGPLEGRPFADLIETVALEHGVDPALVHAVVRAESNYHARARSQMGARGLMQVMPATGAGYGVRNLYDPRANLQAGVRYLKSLLERFNLPQAIAAYNAGPEVVTRYGGVPPFPETQQYVRRVLSDFRR